MDDLLMNLPSILPPHLCIFCNNPMDEFKLYSTLHKTYLCEHCKPGNVMEQKVDDSKYIIVSALINNNQVHQEKVHFKNYSIIKLTNDTWIGILEKNFNIFDLFPKEEYNFVYNVKRRFQNLNIDLKTITEDKLKLYLTFS